MADKTDNTPQAGTAPDDAAHALPVTIHAQYIKDLSFENPRGPLAVPGGDARPAMDVNFSMDARKLEGADIPADLYEVVLGIEVRAERGGQVDFLAELEYATLVSIGAAIPEDQIHPLLLIEIPRQAFPFARQIVADLTQQAGYPPLLLSPVDFRAFYLQRFGGQDAAPPRAAQG